MIRAIKRLYALYLSWLNSIDEDELLARCIDGSASTAWCVLVLQHLAVRRAHIAELRGEVTR